MQKSLLLLALVLSAAITNSPQAFAGYDLEQGMISPNYYGQWATPDCGNPNNVVTIYGHLVMDATTGTNLTYRITETTRKSGFYAGKVATLTFFFKQLPENNLSIARIYDEDRHDDVPLAEQVKSHALTYRKCDKADLDLDWSSRYAPAIRAAPKIMALENACNGAYIEDSRACQQESFAFVDTDTSAGLDRQELERAYTLMVFYAGSSDCEFPHLFTDRMHENAKAFAAQAIETMDENKDEVLSLAEIIDGWEIASLEHFVHRFLLFSNHLAVLLYTIPHYPYIER